MHSHSSSHDWPQAEFDRSAAHPARQRAATWADWGAQLLLLGMPVVCSWTYAGTQPRVQVWLFAAMAVVVLLWLIKKVVDRTWNPTLPWAVLPLALGLAWGGLQLLPLDQSLVKKFSPAADRFRTSLLPGPESDDASLAADLKVAEPPIARPLSLYPASTRRDLAIFALGVAAFVGGAVFFTRSPPQLLLCAVLAFNGAGIAFFEIVQRVKAVDELGQLNWRTAWARLPDTIGPFINPNNAGGFLNLCLAGALGWSLWALRRESQSTTDAPHSPDRNERPQHRHWLEIVGQLNSAAIGALSLAAATIAGILCTKSRGAMLSMAGGFVITAVALWAAHRRSTRLAWIGVALTLAMVFVGWVGMVGPVGARVSTVTDLPAALAPRLNHWRDGWTTAQDFRLTGSGLGTYRFVYPPYQQRPDRLWYTHAENHYLEVLVEAGVPGLALVLATIALVAGACWRVVRRATDDRTFAFGIAAVFALSTQVIHAFFDFGMYMPANMLLTFLIAGAGSATAAALPAPSAARVVARSAAAGSWRRPLVSGLAVGLLALLVWGGRETTAVAMTHRAVALAPKNVRLQNLEQPDVPHLVDQTNATIAALSQALLGRPDDAEAHYQLSLLHTQVYRLKLWDVLRNQPSLGLPAAELWDGTLPAYLHAQAHRLCEYNRYADWQQVRREPLVQQHLLPALSEALLARNACPLLSEVHLTLAQLCPLVTTPLNDRVHLERARLVQPGDSEVFYWSGFAEFQAGRLERAASDWRRCLEMDRRRLADILKLAPQRFSGVQILRGLLPDVPDLLIEVARTRYAEPRQAAARRILAQRAEKLLAPEPLDEDERHYYNAVLAALRDDYKTAIEQYGLALERRVLALRWRYELAVLLQQQGQPQKAHEQALICVRMEPGNQQYRTLLEQINRTRLTATGGQP